MKLISVVILSLLFLACSKQEEEQEQFFIPIAESQNLSINDLIGTTSRALEWEFSDYDTQENYDLLEVSSESDTIYVHFAQEGLLVVHVHRVDDHSFYKWKYYVYHYDDNNDIYFIKDDLLRFKITEASNTRFSFEGKHELHNQFQTVDVLYAKMNIHPEIVKDLMNIK